MNIVRMFLFFSLFAIIGCSSIGLIIGPAISGVTYWVGGEAHRYYEKEPILVYRATKHALKELDIPITRDQEKNNTFYIIAGEKNRFSIRIRASENNNLTKFSNRINYIGDKNFAELIYKKVDEKLNIVYFDDDGNPTSK